MTLPPLNVLDALLVIIFLWNFFRGLKKGAIEEILSIVGIVVSLFVAVKTSHFFAAKVADNPTTPVIVIVGFLIYGVCFLISKYIAFTINARLSEGFFGMINNILGFILGFVRGLILAGIFVTFIGIAMPDSYLVKKSYLGGFFVPVGDFIISHLPENAKKKVFANWEDARGNLLKNKKEWKKEEKGEKKVLPS